MSSDKFNEENPGRTVGNQPEENVSQAKVEAVTQQTDGSQAEAAHKEQEKSSGDITGEYRTEPTPSPSTDESISSYIERTLQTLGCQETGLGLTFLLPVKPLQSRIIIGPRLKRYLSRTLLSTLLVEPQKR